MPLMAISEFGHFIKICYSDVLVGSAIGNKSPKRKCLQISACMHKWHAKRFIQCKEIPLVGLHTDYTLHWLLI